MIDQYRTPPRLTMSTPPGVEAATETQLLRVPMLSALSKRQARRLLRAAKTVSHSPGHQVTEEDRGALALHLILAGTATVTVRGRPRRDLGPGDYFGEISLIDGRPRSATVTAQSRLTTLAVPHLAFQGLLDDEPEVARQLLVGLCGRLREAESAG